MHGRTGTASLPRARSLVLAALAIALLGALVVSGTPLIGGIRPPTNFGLPCMPLPRREGTPVLGLRFERALSAMVTSAPFATGSRIVVATTSGRLIAVDARDGTTIWHVSLGSGVDVDLAGDAGQVVVAARDGVLRSFSISDGRPRWSTDLGTTLGPPTVAGRDVLIASTTGGAYRLDASSGRQAWHIDTGAGMIGAPTVDSGTVYLAGLDGSVDAVSIDKGNETGHFDARGSVEASAAVGADLLVAVTRDGKARAFDRRTGDATWTARTDRDLPLYGTPAIAGGLVAAGSSDCAVHAFDASTGNERWTYGALGPIDTTIVTITGKAIFCVASDDGTLSLLDRDGTPVARSQPYSPLTSPVAGAGYLTVGTEDGRLLVFDTP